MPEDINEWIRQRLNKGEDPNILKEKLIAAGWDSIIVDQKISSIYPTIQRNELPTGIGSETLNPIQNKKRDVKKFKINKYIILGLIILIFPIIFYMFQIDEHSPADRSDDFQILNETERQDSSGNVRETNPSCEMLIRPDDKEDCYLIDEAEAKGDFSICETVKAKQAKFSCYRKVSKSKQDPSVCEEIQYTPGKEACYITIAGIMQDLSICDKVEREKEGCYNEVGIAKQDLSICDKIESEFIRENCYMEIAVAKQDLSICDKIKVEFTRNLCYSEIDKAKQGNIS